MLLNKLGRILRERTCVYNAVSRFWIQQFSKYPSREEVGPDGGQQLIRMSVCALIEERESEVLLVSAVVAGHSSEVETEDLQEIDCPVLVVVCANLGARQVLRVGGKLSNGGWAWSCGSWVLHHINQRVFIHLGGLSHLGDEVEELDGVQSHDFHVVVSETLDSSELDLLILKHEFDRSDVENIEGKVNCVFVSLEDLNVELEGGCAPHAQAVSLVLPLRHGVLGAIVDG